MRLVPSALGCALLSIAIYAVAQEGAKKVNPHLLTRPTIVLQDGKLRFVLGSPGGARIISTVANIFLSAAEQGLNIQQAVDAPRFHHQYLPDKLYLEQGFSPDVIAGLRAQGYQLDFEEHHWSNGECIAVDPNTGEFEGGQDHRSHYGKAAGY